MTGRLVVVTGTGTGIGKTHLAEALLLGWAGRGLHVVGLKPVESGVGPGVLTDARRLSRASNVHVATFGVALPEPVSPHLAARRAGVTLDLQLLRAEIAAARNLVQLALVELPGGLFTPLASGVLNADFAATLSPDATLVVAPDRLGVLHDLLAVFRAIGSLSVAAIALVAPEHADASTGSNASELALLVPTVPVFPVGRASPPALATSRSVVELLTQLTTNQAPR
jgi:dethiobiotin synthetase